MKQDFWGFNLGTQTLKYQLVHERIKNDFLKLIFFLFVLALLFRV